MATENSHVVITDITLVFCSTTDLSSDCEPDPSKWRRLEKELYLHTSQENAWIYVSETKEKDLSTTELVITDVRIGRLPDANADCCSWESRPGGIWVQRSNYTGDSHRAMTGIDVLFGTDAVDPRPNWALIQSPLELNAKLEIPVAKITVRYGTTKPRPGSPRLPLKTRPDGKFKIVQISDTHMVTGVGVCKDAIDGHGKFLPESEADPLTVEFVGRILDIENPDLVVLTGDQLHHDILDSQSALFKIVAPLIERSIPYAAVFGNHDDEGVNALSREKQMAILQDLPFSLCQPGPVHIDGVGNYYLQIFGHESSHLPLSTLYFLDSHGEVSSSIRSPDYDYIKPSQIDWFTRTSQALRKERENDKKKHFHLSLAFMHIPLPEYGHSSLRITGGQRREPTEGPSFNSHFYDALVDENLVAVGCGHDHVNDFCGLLPHEDLQYQNTYTSVLGPWLCYGGGTGFGGYCSYGLNRYHRRSRVWEFDANTGSLKTWKRVEYGDERIDLLGLAEGGTIVAP